MNDLDLRWIGKVKMAHPEAFAGKRVLELGSLDVNGSLWDVFENCDITGVDWQPGPHVTVVAKCHETDFEPESFDVLLSANHLEHDPIWQESLGHNLPALKPGGLILLRWATTRSSAHGPEFDPDGKSGYYPKDRPEITAWLIANGCTIEDQYDDHNPYIGIMANVVARKA